MDQSEIRLALSSSSVSERLSKDRVGEGGGDFGSLANVIRSTCERLTSDAKSVCEFLSFRPRPSTCVGVRVFVTIESHCWK